jgi:hypothetical protein
MVLLDLLAWHIVRLGVQSRVTFLGVASAITATGPPDSKCQYPQGRSTGDENLLRNAVNIQKKNVMCQEGSV